VTRRLARALLAISKVYDEIGREAGFLLIDVSGGIATVRR
jgi:hypothetical protein